MLSFLAFAVFCLFAGRVAAFNMTVGNSNLDVSQILNIPDSPVKTACSVNCTDTSSKIAACNNNVGCLCSADTVASLLGCETCMFQFLIQTNTRAPNFLAGSNPLLGAYAGACKSEGNITLAANQTALLLPSTWNGPFVSVLPFGGAIVTVLFGATLGFSALYILSNVQ